MHKLSFAVMGNPIAHSLSPAIHQQFAGQTGRLLRYEKICVDVDLFEQNVRDFFNDGGFGLNITAPFKQRAFAMSDAPTSRCQQAQAANTLWFYDGKLYADNTDGIGLLRDLEHYIDVFSKRILVLGAGGAVRGILPSILLNHPAQVTIANRTIEKAKSVMMSVSAACASEQNSKSEALLKHQAGHINCCDLVDIQGPFDLVINGTSMLSTQPHLSTSMLASNPFCYDLNYQQNGLTPFVQWAQAQDCRAIDGLGMLIEQAAEAFFLWHGVRPDVAKVNRLALSY